MSMVKTKQPKYLDGRTKQSFKDETDINRLLQRAQKTGTISHLNKHEARYGDFRGFDFFEAQLRLAQGREIFADLPSELRSEFNQNPAEFFDYVNDPANKDNLARLLPELAEPERKNVEVTGTVTADEIKKQTASEEQAREHAKEKEPKTEEAPNGATSLAKIEALEPPPVRST